MSNTSKASHLEKIKQQSTIASDDVDALAAFGTGSAKMAKSEIKKPRGRPKQKAEKVSNIPFVPPSEKFKHDFKLLALNEKTSMQALMMEGLRLVFESRGKDFNKYVNK